MEKDKLLHLGVGFLIGVVGVIASSPTLGLTGAVLAGIGKEVYDQVDNTLAARKGLAPRHSVDPKDFVATVAGGAIAFVLGLVLA